MGTNELATPDLKFNIWEELTNFLNFIPDRLNDYADVRISFDNKTLQRINGIHVQAKKAINSSKNDDETYYIHLP